MKTQRATKNAPPKRSATPAPVEQVVAAAPPAELQWLTIRGARHNNLKNIDVSIPLGRFVVVTGVSGSGKSSLINDILHDALARDLNGALSTPGVHDSIEGIEHLDKIIAIDQTPIGRTPRSNAATYIKVFDEIRDLFTKLPDAKLRGYKPGRFSFNVAAGPKGGGRCEACEGNGSNKIEMDFLADVWVTCPVCEGKRFGRETLQIQFKGKSIADILEMDVQTAIEHFDSQSRIRAMLDTLHDVGLDYLKIGQPSTTLSGGEAQRIKLARELVKKPTGRTMYVLDEPTTGLHFEDIRKLLVVLHSFVDAGNSVVVIEHNLDVIKTADWLIDIGPEGGEGGGRVIAEGTPEDLCAVAESHTGVALREYLQGAKGPRGQGDEEKSATARPSGEILPLDPRPLAPSAPSSRVLVRGAREHNLKDLTIEFPRDQITVCTGVSGSGKTSFAIDTVFTEGYRRYVESLSAYARQFLGQMQKPRVEHVEGLSPAICIEQKAASKSPRSTVGTITEIYDYMRVLWARVGTPFCPQCQQPIGSQTVDQIVDRVMALGEGTPIVILAPVALGDGETYNTLFTRLKNSGYTRVRIDGVIQETVQAVTLDARRKHRVEVVADRTIVKAKSRSRINESVEHALAMGNGLMTLVAEAVEIVEERHEGTEARRHEGEVDSASLSSPSCLRASVPPCLPEREFRFSQRLACMKCGNSYEDLSPHSFSFNSQMGWCETCEGLGFQRGAPAESIIVQPDQPLLRGAIAGWGTVDPKSQFGRLLVALCERLGVRADMPLSEWPHAARQALLYGTEGEWISEEEAKGSRGQGAKGKTSTRDSNVRSTPRPLDSSAPAFRFHWRGFFPTIDNATRNSWALRHRLHNVVSDVPCLTCRGGRLRPDAAAVRLLPQNAELRMQNAEKKAAGADGEDVLHSAFCILHSDSPTLVAICQWPLSRVHEFFNTIKLDKR
ncbi:MAG: ATP-binding cassette domain-containing protein, partial [Phycisphaerae bacterium]